ncbi:MAG: protein-disulfide reductase DsbD, partial [Dokdonella sp.]
AKTSQAGISLGEIQLPDGNKHHDEFLGDVETYHHSIDATLPYSLSGPAPTVLEITVTAQGCHETDPKICYPPQPTKLSLTLPANSAIATSADSTTPPTLSLGAGGQALGTTAPLPPDKAFVFEAISASPTQILARWTMPKNYYLYRDKTTLKVSNGSGVTLGQPVWPQGVEHIDEHFGQVIVYFDQVELPIPIRREKGAAERVALTAEYQGCLENGICYPVMTRSVMVELPAATPEQLAAAAKDFVPMAAGGSAASTSAPSLSSTSVSTSTPSDQNTLRSRPPQTSALGLVGALLFALLGGLVLNLMPCVLPVLSFKLLGLVQSGESETHARSHALWYTLGVMTSFAAIGLLVIGLRAAGQALGWGFQLQQPLFVALLVYLMIAVGLSLSGVFQIGGGIAGVGSNLASKSGPAGDFFTGVLACVVASPCTAPFMGGALAYAFAASPLIALAVFLALGLGLALPFLVVGFVPAFARLLPKPGAWMETFKQVLAFPMYLTAVWLLWVLGQQRGVDAIGLILIGAVVLALALWWLGRAARLTAFARVAIAALLLIAVVPIWGVTRLSAPSAVADADSEPYSRARLDALRSEGRTVFVDMTADWCATCKLNERAVLGTDHFRDLLKQTNAVYMKGDWTNVDPAISAFLDEHHSVGVPLYVVYRGKDNDGEVLPTLLTSAIVDAALKPASP